MSLSKKYINVSVKKILLILLFLCLVLNGFSQSRYLENGIGGSCFAFNTNFSSPGITSLGASAAYSIGGIMDIGFQLSRENGTIEGTDSTAWNFDFLYNIIVIKQSDVIPLSIQLEAGYGFSNISSNYLTTNNITRGGQGFNMGASVFREFNSKGLFSFLVGGKINYKNFMFTEVDSSGTASLTTTDRDEDFFVGGITAVSFKPEKWPIFTIELEVLYNQYADSVFFQPSLLIISPKF